MVWVAWNKTAPILPMKGKFVKPIIWVLINEFWFLLGCLHIESWTTTPRDLLPGAILVGQVIQHYLVITRWSVQFQMQLCLSKTPSLCWWEAEWCAISFLWEFSVVDDGVISIIVGCLAYDWSSLLESLTRSNIWLRLSPIPKSRSESMKCVCLSPLHFWKRAWIRF